MHSGQLIFAQLMEFLPRHDFDACVRRYGGDRRQRGKTHDVKVLDHLPLEPGAFCVMDRGDMDFARLDRFTQQDACFVTRAKKNLVYSRRTSRVIDKTTGLRADQTIVLSGLRSSRLYSDPLRRVTDYDAEHDRRFVFLTNNFTLPALTIAELHRCRWPVELFFKWIKQHLRIQAFYGHTENAVKTPVWTAISTCVLVAIVKKKLKLDLSLYDILQNRYPLRSSGYHRLCSGKPSIQ